MALVVCEASSHVQHDYTDLCRGSHSCCCFAGLFCCVNKSGLLITFLNARADVFEEEEAADPSLAS